ncbi:MAG TPA: tetratricopeptide repeat protein [Solirubrobacteraceae bacterium]|jgi:tetratricopeptide (TPR) repeat protein|nr:tetratricopeptide repeat protein [Solirubrobacteraceae bacterium]
MSRRREIVAVIATGCLALGGVTGETVAPAVAASTTGSATAPQSLVHQYPLGPQRLCCNGQTGVSGTTSSSAPNRSAPPAGVTSAPGRARTPGKPVGHRASGGVSAALLIGLGVLALLIVAGATAAYRTRRQTAPVLGRGLPVPAPLASSNGAAPVPRLGTDTATPGAEPTWDHSPVVPVAASEAEEREFRRLDANGDAGGAFNLGVVLHQRADVEGATAAYERAERRGDPDAAFNLGVLLYEAGDLHGADAAWRRSAARGHVRAAGNLLFVSRRLRESERGVATQSEAAGFAEFEELSYRRADESGAASGAFNLGVMLHQQGDTAGAAAAYERAERRGDHDAAFNLGVLLYEAGDLDGAEAAWRRSAGRGHARAAEDLDFLLRHRHELETAGVAGEEGVDR